MPNKKPQPEQLRAIFPMLKAAGCPRDKPHRTNWINDFLKARNMKPIKSSINDFTPHEAGLFQAALTKHLEESNANVTKSKAR